MIFFKFHSGIGNQMFQYAFGKILEKDRDIPVYFLCKKSEFKLGGFDGIRFIDSSSRLFRFVERYICKFNFRYQEFHSCLEEVDLNSISNFTYVSGYFQSSKLYEENRDFIRGLFKISTFKPLQSNTCVVHIRRGDYLTTVFKEINANAIIPEVWFRDQLLYIKNEYSPDFFHAVGDDSTYIKDFCNDLEFDVMPVIESPIKDFVKLMTSKYLIISNSSFAWWAAFLNINEDVIVIAPKNWVGFNVGIEYPKGIMNSRFIWR